MEMWRQSKGRDTLFGSCLARANEVRRNGRIAGILWYQGESDASSELAARGWDKGFADFAAAFRKALDIPDLPIVYAQLGNISKERFSTPKFAYWLLVKEVQAKVIGPNLAMISADKFELSGDGIHLTTRGYLRLGREFANIMKQQITR